MLVSSHLMSEMEDTADHLVVLGRGPAAGRRPDGGAARRALRRPGAHARRGRCWPTRCGGPAAGSSWRSTARCGSRGSTSSEVGDVAFVADVRLHELSRVTASLEAAYLALTDDDVEYRAVAP